MLLMLNSEEEMEAGGRKLGLFSGFSAGGGPVHRPGKTDAGYS